MLVNELDSNPAALLDCYQLAFQEVNLFRNGWMKSGSHLTFLAAFSLFWTVPLIVIIVYVLLSLFWLKLVLHTMEIPLSLSWIFLFTTSVQKLEITCFCLLESSSVAGRNCWIYWRSIRSRWQLVSKVEHSRICWCNHGKSHSTWVISLGFFLGHPSIYCVKMCLLLHWICRVVNTC